ncbi:hypothetical protein U9M48_022019 [Paspalum notatum var. saurae]|uniref:Uncharacterized protein n=1 Tax=Paspalum notatum var. saurae TaxID=547442 RepID=A0AAQ3TIV1_PASNO
MLPWQSGTEEWRRNADTHTMSAKEVRSSMRPPGRGPGEVLHQRGRLPYGPGTMAAVGLGIVSVISYARPGTSTTEVAKVAVGHGDPAAGREPERRATGEVDLCGDNCDNNTQCGRLLEMATRPNHRPDRKSALGIKLRAGTRRPSPVR